MPDVFILGFTKCATTSLYNQLVQHPDVSNTTRKEPHFHFAQVMGDKFSGPADDDAISQMFVTDADKYQALYEPGKLSIDGSAMSIEDPRIVDQINQQYPQAKCIVMLRDPVQRAFSAYSHLVRDARETLSFKQAVAQELAGKRDGFLPIWRNLQSSRYVEATQYARSVFGERLKVVSYHDYATNNQLVMDEVASFIGIQPMAWQRDLANRSGVPHSKMLQKILMRKSLAKTLFVKLFPRPLVTSLKRSLMERNTGNKPFLSAEDKAFFQQLLKDECSKILPNTPDTELLRSLY